MPVTSVTTLEELVELLRRPPYGAEVLVDAGACILGERERWCAVRKTRRGARFPVVVELGKHAGTGQYRLDEILGMRKARRASR